MPKPLRREPPMENHQELLLMEGVNASIRRLKNERLISNRQNAPTLLHRLPRFSWIITPEILWCTRPLEKEW